MKILNRYFTRQLIAIFVMLMLVLTGLAWMMQIMSMMKFLLKYGINITDFLGLTALMIPFIASIIVPFVCFISVVFVYNKMIADNEVTVMAASGMSPWQIARPAVRMGIVLTALNLILNVWVVPISQSKFYDTQWNLQYGMAHMKLQESAFTEIADGLVVYVDKVSGHDLGQVMLSDRREDSATNTIFAEKGKLISTVRGLSLVMTNGSLQSTGNHMITGTFETFDMDLNIVEKSGSSSFRVRRIPTSDLVRVVFDAETKKQHKMILTELCNRFINPFMNLLLAMLCATILLRSSLLRRRASFAPIASVAAMAGVMALYMAATNMIASLTDFVILVVAVAIVLGGVFIALVRK
ncbi:MAG: LptF/LptG family permease [Alphaproteobacteria bacterium]|nr:LptF/LptG family permease [Alphaproteobacteria bacterium]MBR6685129.1 LptF/LptG family permease [Alphaproteobacteria bacterium]